MIVATGDLHNHALQRCHSIGKLTKTTSPRRLTELARTTCTLDSSLSAVGIFNMVASMGAETTDSMDSTPSLPLVTCACTRCNDATQTVRSLQVQVKGLSLRQATSLEWLTASWPLSETCGWVASTSVLSNIVPRVPRRAVRVRLRAGGVLKVLDGDDIAFFFVIVLRAPHLCLNALWFTSK